MSNDVLTLPEAPESLSAIVNNGGAIAWSEPVTMTTYEPNEPDEYPIYFERRVYQGSSGRVYPIPFIDGIAAEGKPREWQAIHLENRWLRLMILPELGGRIHVGYDKTADYDFFYRNNVIKPALVGLAGPWISGGVEFNWPQHHRPGTFLPVETSIENHDDGSVTVWCSDHDPFDRMKGMHGIRIHPDRAVVESVVRLHNRTSETHTFLWWANVAARVHDDYQSFFPTDVHYVADHARRAITAFPRADRPYYGVDYPSRAEWGGDRLDFYRNITVPTSYMVVGSQDDFFGGYDHAAQAGFVHVADRHIAPGKKQWTWGNAAFGRAWDSLLTDNDGPYVELMAGVYTDNQPDFAWLQPGETKQFTQTWYPIQKIGVVHQATADVAVHLSLEGGVARVGVAATREIPGAHIALHNGGLVINDWIVDLAPGEPFIESEMVTVGSLSDLRLTVGTDEEQLLVWQHRGTVTTQEPEVATAPPLPHDIASVDELYMTGIHLLQYRHPTRSPLPYWHEALARDPEDARCNLAIADSDYRRGLYSSAEAHTRTALRRLTVRNNNPRDGEASYLLGLILTRLGRLDEAIDAFGKAAWDGRWAAPALVEAGRLAAQLGRVADALDYGRRSAAIDPRDSRAVMLQAIGQRYLADDPASLLEAVLAHDPLDQTVLYLSTGAVPSEPRTAIDVALDLAKSGAMSDALEVLDHAARLSPTVAGDIRALAHYHRARILESLGQRSNAAEARSTARACSVTRCFPKALDDHDALSAALVADPDDATALSLLATLLVDAGRKSEARELWTRAFRAGLEDAVALRNAALVTYETTANAEDALKLYRRAIELRPTDARLLYEMDQLFARAGKGERDRLAFYEANREAILTRDDAAVEYCDLLIACGRPQAAIDVLCSRTFSPWEGGEGRALSSWETAQVAVSRALLAAKDPLQAARHASLALTPPRSLNEARLENEAIGWILQAQANALRALSRYDEADALERRAIQEPSGPDQVTSEVDYFATSLPQFTLFSS